VKEKALVTLFFVIKDYRAIRKELEAYSPTLAAKPEYIVLNKIDVVDDDANLWIEQLQKEGISIFASISAATHRNTDELMQKLLPMVLKAKEDRLTEVTERMTSESAELPVLRPDLESEKMGAFRIEKNENTILVRGKRLEQFTVMTNFEQVGARQRFENVIERIGLLKALEPLRTAETEVWIGKNKVTEYLP
jgi:GTP-binding protein